MVYRKTPLAAKELGISYHRLFFLVRFGAIEPPQRDSSGHYLWSDEDIERARKAIAARGEEKKQRKAKSAA